MNTLIRRWQPMYSASDISGGAPKVSDLLERYNSDPQKLAEKLADVLGDNHKYRQVDEPRLEQRITALKNERDEYKGKVPSDGSVILTADDAKEYEALKALGTASDLQGKLAQAETTATEYARLKREQELQATATAMGWNVDALKAADRGYQYEVKDVEQDGKKVREAYVVDGETRVPAADRFGPLYPALIAGSTPEPMGTRYPIQVGGTGTPVDVTQRFIEQRDQQNAARPNPLIAAKGS